MNKIRAKKTVEKLLRIYDIGKRDARGGFLLDKNERVDKFSEEFLGGFIAQLSSDVITKYPDQSLSYSLLSSFLGVPEENVIIFPGSDAALKAIFEAFIYPKDKVLCPSPTYAMFEVYSKLFDSDVLMVDYSEEKIFDIDAYINKICSGGVKIAYLPNPGQPYGDVIGKEDLLKIIRVAKEMNTLVVVDEAYYEFCGVTVLHNVSEISNLIVMRTFSKAYGMAGLRLGYLVVPAWVKNTLYKVKPMHDLNSLSLLFMNYIIQRKYIVEDYVSMIQESAAYVKELIRRKGGECYYNDTNYIYISIPPSINPNKIGKCLCEKGVLVRVNYDGINAGSIRVTLTNKKNMEEVVEHIYGCQSLMNTFDGSE